MTKEVVIIAGANGSGKTTFARSFEEKYPFAFVNADEIAKEINPGDIENPGVKVQAVFLENPGVCIERIRERVLKGGHFVPDADVVRRFYRSKRNFWNLYKELADEWYLIYNSKQQFIELALGQKGTYTINNKKLFNEFIIDIKEEKNNGSR